MKQLERTGGRSDERDTAKLYGNRGLNVHERELTGSEASLYILIKEYKHWTSAYSAPREKSFDSRNPNVVSRHFCGVNVGRFCTGMDRDGTQSQKSQKPLSPHTKMNDGLRTTVLLLKK